MTFPFLYFLLLLGYIFSYGTFNVTGLAILSLSLMFLSNCQINKINKKDLAATLVLTLSLSLLVEKLLYPSFHSANFIIKGFLVFSLILSSFYLFRLPLRKTQLIFYILVATSFLLRIFIIFASPQPQIDAFHLLKEAPQYLLTGTNPYQAIYPKIYANVTPDYYTYFPGSIFLFLPVVLLFRDPRWLYLIIYAIIFLLIKKLVKDKINSQLFTLILFYQPLSLVIFEQGFSEMLLSGLLFLAFHHLYKKKTVIASLIIGILAATKQSMLFVLPFFLLTLIQQGKKIRKNLILMAIPPILILVPFIIWNPSAFWHDTIYYHLNINRIRTDLVGFSLNYLSLSKKLFDFELTSSPIYSVLLVFALYLIIFSKKPVEKIADLPLALSIFFLGFHLFGVQAYMNYYFLISNLLLFSQILENVKNE